MANKKKTQAIEKPFFIQIVIPLYRISVIVFLGVSLEEIIKTGIKRGIKSERFTTNWKQWIENEMEQETQGLVCDFGEKNKDVLMWIRKRPRKLSEYAVLYHELYHVVDHIADSRNFSQDDKISEPKAYLFEYLFTEISKVLWSKSA